MNKGDLDLFERSDLFDKDWYVQQYPDVEILGMDPAEHYLRFGWRLNRKPSANFNQQNIPGWNVSHSESAGNPLIAYLRSQCANTSSSLQSVAKADDTSVPTPDVPSLSTNGVKHSPKIGDGQTPKASQRSDYALLAAHFDEEFYLRRYQDIARGTIDPALHYLNNGGKELRFPCPDFDPKYYTKKYSDVKPSKTNPYLHYLKVGRQEGRSPSAMSAGNPHYDGFSEMLGISATHLQSAVANRKKDIRKRLKSGELGEMVARAEKLEPLIKHAWLEALRPGVSPVRSPQMTQQMFAMHNLQEQADWQRAKVAVLVPWVHVSGAARVAGFLTAALASVFGASEVVVVRTETSEFQFPEWFPAECRQIDFATQADGLAESARERLLVEYLRSLRLEHVFNVNSRTFWGALNSFGVALSKSMELHTYLFCNEKNLYGDWVGYPVRNYHKFADILQSVICDSQFLRNELHDRFIVPSEQADGLTVIETPINSIIKVVNRKPRVYPERPRVYWAGRFDRQKRVDIAFAIANEMPDVDFHFWGKPRLDLGFEKLQTPKNVTLEGLYKEFEDLPLSECDAWLYTAEWDGVPNILLDVASAAVPLVGSVAGGTGEVLLEGYSEPIIDIQDIDAYVAGLRRVIEDPKTAKKRALELRERILKQRSNEAYVESIKTLLARGTPHE